tara:strand:+ start:46 stop:531 length:486 start_codon:yes stop_codon:yes gene_type:complete
MDYLTTIAFYVSTEALREDVIKKLREAKKYIIEWGNYYNCEFKKDGGEVSGNKLVEYFDDVIVFVEENTNNNGYDCISFKDLGNYGVSDREANDLESGEIDFTNSIDIITPYEGKVDCIRIQMNVPSLYVADIIDNIMSYEGLDISGDMYDITGDYGEFLV